MGMTGSSLCLGREARMAERSKGSAFGSSAIFRAGPAAFRSLLAGRIVLLDVVNIFLKL